MLNARVIHMSDLVSISMKNEKTLENVERTWLSRWKAAREIKEKINH
jgi:hypothetical protein